MGALDHSQNCFFLGPDDTVSRMPYVNEIVVAGEVQEVQNMKDVIAISLGRTNYQSDDLTSPISDFKMFVPKFRILEGNPYSSDPEHTMA